MHELERHRQLHKVYSLWGRGRFFVNGLLRASPYFSKPPQEYRMLFHWMIFQTDSLVFLMLQRILRN